MSDSGKYKLTVEPALPSKCTGCGFDADGRKEFLDTTMSLDFYGAVLFCEDCVREMAATVGMVPAEMSVSLEQEVEEANLAIARLEEKVESLERVVFTYRMPNPVTVSGGSISDSVAIHQTNSDDVEGNSKFS